MRSRIVVATMFFICILLVAAVCIAAPNVGDVAPQIMVTDSNGQSVGLLKNDKVTILNFWATWCPPCRAEMPELNNFVQKYRNQVNFHAITDEAESTVNSFIRRNGYSIPILLDTYGGVSRMYGITAIPTTFIIDTNGVIRHRIVGGTTMSKLEALVADL